MQGKNSGGRNFCAKTCRACIRTRASTGKERNLGESIFARLHAGPVFALARLQDIFLINNFPHNSQILEGIHLGANTCRACIRTRANTKTKILVNYSSIRARGYLSMTSPRATVLRGSFGRREALQQTWFHHLNAHPDVDVDVQFILVISAEARGPGSRGVHARIVPTPKGTIVCSHSLPDLHS